MRRGTNPVLTFELPEAITISALYITFQQNRQTVLEKDLTAVTYDKENGIITLPLSQEDTLLFSELEPVWVQLRLRDNLDNAIASEPINHDKLKEKLKKLDLEPVVYDLLCIYIDCSDGLPLGYQTSQLFALLFLDDFDHFVKEQLHIQYYGRYMDDFFLIHPDKEYLQFCLREIRAYMDSLGLELNEKTQIFPIRNGIDFLGFHTYLTESGKVIRKLRHSSIKRMRAKLRHWEKEYPAGLVTREQILQSWQAWDAHAAHGNTWALRQQVRDRVQNILKEEI